MKKVLIIANLIHANPRIVGIAKYLVDFGWEPTIITIPVPLSDDYRARVRVVETKYSGDIFEWIRKILKLIGFRKEKNILNEVKAKAGEDSRFFDNLFKMYFTVFAYPDEERKWRKIAENAGREILKKEKFDAIISSSSPVTAHIVANKLKREFNLPWIADFRDLWTQNHNYYKFSCGLRKFFEEKLEIRTIKNADALVTVCYPWVEKLKMLHKKDDVFEIMNGFDSEIENTQPKELSRKFTITYTGQIYDGKQDPFKILIAIKELIDKNEIEKENIELRFYGPAKEWLESEIKRLGLEVITKQYGIVKRSEAIEKQRESQILLKLNWEDETHKGGYTGKIFEYLAARRPILATGGKGDITEGLLNKTKAGIYVKTIEEIKNYLKEAYNQYKKTGAVEFRGNLGEIEKFNYKKAAEKFCQILNKKTYDKPF